MCRHSPNSSINNATRTQRHSIHAGRNAPLSPLIPLRRFRFLKISKKKRMRPTFEIYLEPSARDPSYPLRGSSESSARVHSPVASGKDDPLRSKLEGLTPSRVFARVRRKQEKNAFLCANIFNHPSARTVRLFERPGAPRTQFYSLFLLSSFFLTKSAMYAQ